MREEGHLMRHPDPQLFLRIAIADAYAAGAEYLKFPRDEDVRKACLAFTGYVGHPTHGLAPGLYTDDTEMSVANARVLLERASPYAARMFADEYVAEFLRGGKRKGYAKGFQAFLESIGSGTEFLAKIRPDSDKNGAAMRAMPIGALPTIQEVLDVATLQARVTHDTPAGRFSARAVALMTHFALYEDAPLSELREYCKAYLPKDEDWGGFTKDPFRHSWPDRLPVKSYSYAPVAITTVQAALTAVVEEGSLMAMLKRIIEWGGDTDSVAAIAWGIASPRFPDEKLPEFMERDLEQGSPRTGPAYLRDLGARLMTKFG
jgi:ADP-ribosylglycohydrolase